MKFSQPKEDQRAAILQKQQRLKMARSAQAAALVWAGA